MGEQPGLCDVVAPDDLDGEITVDADASIGLLDQSAGGIAGIDVDAPTLQAKRLFRVYPEGLLLIAITGCRQADYGGTVKHLPILGWLGAGHRLDHIRKSRTANHRGKRCSHIGRDPHLNVLNVARVRAADRRAVYLDRIAGTVVVVAGLACDLIRANQPELSVDASQCSRQGSAVRSVLCLATIRIHAAAVHCQARYTEQGKDHEYDKDQ